MRLWFMYPWFDDVRCFRTMLVFMSPPFRDNRLAFAEERWWAPKTLWTITLCLYHCLFESLSLPVLSFICIHYPWIYVILPISAASQGLYTALPLSISTLKSMIWLIYNSSFSFHVIWSRRRADFVVLSNRDDFCERFDVHVVSMTYVWCMMYVEWCMMYDVCSL